MLPIELKICGFGPFKEEQVIDFTKLNGLFLISGNTGSGKSTIFDAIIFALYGEASGSYRSPNSFRSSFCDYEDLSYVHLTFSHLNKTYLIKRAPSYLRKKKRGEGLIREDSKSELIYDDKIFTINREVDLQIESILGIKAVQFKQIFMIAQNEFMKLLIVNSDERSKILRKLFNTERLENLQISLKEATKKKEADYKAIKDDILNYQQSISYKNSQSYSNIELLNQYLLELNNYLETKEQELREKRNSKKELESKKSTLEIEINHQKNYQMKVDQLANNKKELAKHQQDAMKIEKLKQDLIVIDEIIKKILPIVSNLKAKNQELKENQKLLTIDQKKLNIEKNNLAKIDAELANQASCQERIKEYEKHINEIKLDKYLQMDSIENKIKKLNKDLSPKIASHQQLESKIETNKMRITSHQEFIDQNFEIDNQINNVNNKIKELSEKIIQLEEGIINQKELKKYKTKLNSSQNNLNKEARELYQLRSQYNEDSKVFNLQIAGRLASDLVSNQPCPVCGSLDHPDPARVTNKAITENYLEKLNKEITGKDNICVSLKLECTKYQEKINNTKTILTKIENNLNTKEFVELHQQSNADLIKLNKDLSVLEAISKEKAEKNQDLKLLKTNLEEFETEFKILTSQINNDKETIAVEDTALKILKTELKYPNRKEAEIALNNFKNEINKLENYLKELNLNHQNSEKNIVALTSNINNYENNINNLKDTIHKFESQVSQQEKKLNITSYLDYDVEQFTSINSKINEYQEQKQKLNTAIDLLEKEVKDFKLVDIKLLLQEKDEITINLQLIEDQISAIISNHSIDVNYFKKIQSLNHDYQQLEIDLKNIKPLNDVINGRMSSSIKLNFETYVQSFYFDLVLQFANERLKKMSAGRYELKRQTENLSKASKVGLDLEIYDAWTNKRRDVTTLSGGESFNASLALALGLSDVIKQNSGGIIVDAMFIDEGFGTLDTEALNKALSVLSSLDNSTKLLGIISHVSELKNNIDQQIEVEKTLSGSKIIERGS